MKVADFVNTEGLLGSGNHACNTYKIYPIGKKEDMKSEKKESP